MSTGSDIFACMGVVLFEESRRECACAWRERERMWLCEIFKTAVKGKQT